MELKELQFHHITQKQMHKLRDHIKISEKRWQKQQKVNYQSGFGIYHMYYGQIALQYDDDLVYGPILCVMDPIR